MCLIFVYICMIQILVLLGGICVENNRWSILLRIHLSQGRSKANWVEPHMDRLLDISVSFCMINNFSTVLGCNLMSNVLKQNQLRNTALNNTFLSSVDENTQDLTSSTLQMIRWSFHQNISPALAVLLLLIWSGPVGTWAKRLWTSHEQQVCCPLSQFPTYGYIPRRLLSIAISSTDIPTSSEVTLYIIVVLFGRLHFLSCLFFFFFYTSKPYFVWLCCLTFFVVACFALFLWARSSHRSCSQRI